METSTRFSNTEITLVISNAIISKLFLVYPSAFAALGASAGIILALSTVFFGFVFTLVTLKLYKTKTDITELLPRKSLKIIFSIIIIALFTGNQGYFVRSVAESLKISIEEKKTCFWSRSRQELWLKGETSGNYQHIVSITADWTKYKATLTSSVTDTNDVYLEVLINNGAVAVDMISLFPETYKGHGMRIDLAEKLAVITLASDVADEALTAVVADAGFEPVGVTAE